MWKRRGWSSGRRNGEMEMQTESAARGKGWGAENTKEGTK